MEWATLPLKRYAEFTGRSRRKEYWMYVLLLIAAYIVVAIVESVLGLRTMIAGMYGPLSLLLALATLVPSLAVSIRRLHDTNRTGWWMLISCVPYVLMLLLLFSGMLSMVMIVSILALAGAIVLLVFMVLEGTKGPNQYGPDPKAAEGVAAGAA